MGGFLSALGQGILDNASQNSPIANSIIARYRRNMNPDPNAMSGQQMVDAMNQNPVPQPTLQPPKIGQNPEQPDPQIGNQNQWNQPQPMKGGAIVTQPTIAKIGEAGPEAVVPLTPRASNKMQPDLLEGHITAPKVPGVRYSRYKSFNRFGRGGGA